MTLTQGGEMDKQDFRSKPQKPEVNERLSAPATRENEQKNIYRQSTRSNRRLMWILLLLGILFALWLLSGLLQNPVNQRQANAKTIVTQYYQASQDNNGDTIKKLAMDKKEAISKKLLTYSEDVTKDCQAVDNSLEKKSRDTYTVKGLCKEDPKQWTFTLHEGINNQFSIKDISTGRNADNMTMSDQDKKCLVEEDAAYFTGSTSTGDIDKSFYSTSIFFQPDSTEYDSMSSADQSLSKFAGFYENNTTKGFTYNLYGQAREATQTPEGQKLAADRIEKIKKDLQAQGVPAERITAVRTESQLDNTDATLDRKVFIEILKDKNCQR